MLIAVVIATIATRYVVGGAPLYGVRSFEFGSPAELVAFAGLGLLAAPVGVGFLRLLGAAGHTWRKVPDPMAGPAARRPWPGGAIPLRAADGGPVTASSRSRRCSTGKARGRHGALAASSPSRSPTAMAVGSGQPRRARSPRPCSSGGCTGALYAFRPPRRARATRSARRRPTPWSASPPRWPATDPRAADRGGPRVRAVGRLRASCCRCSSPRRSPRRGARPASTSTRSTPPSYRVAACAGRLTLDGRRVIESQQDSVDGRIGTRPA